MKKDRITEEKERLMKEVLGKPRSYEKDVKSDVCLEMNDRSYDDGLKAVQKILQKQNEELKELDETRKKANSDMEQFQKEIAKDFGKPVLVDEKDKFDLLKTQLKEELVGQDEALDQLVDAMRRPFVMQEGMDGVLNVMVLDGPVGTGRHKALESVVSHMYDVQLLKHRSVSLIDLSLYQSSSQESIFLQDLYQALVGESDVVVFENYETGFAPILRMVADLVNDGTVQLNKRYVLNKGMLVENQTGLLKQVVDHLSLKGKYIVFLTNNGTRSIQDAFGATVLYRVLDVIRFEAFDEASLRKLVEMALDGLVVKCKNQLQMEIVVEESLLEYVLKHCDKSLGRNAIDEMVYAFFVTISEAKLKLNANTMRLFVEDGIAVGESCGTVVRLLKEKNSQEEIAAIQKELDQIIGLQEVKEYMQSIQSYVTMQNKRKAMGLKTMEMSRHMIFTGNPGTGKTTIARLLARYMKAIGALSKGQLVEVTRKDLVAQYVGQTAPLTMSVLKSSLGGVLFIDEAYGLYRGKEDHFGLECIDTIVKAMEDYREDLIVILAGYEDEMDTFLTANSGLKSRFSNVMHFSDFSGTELFEIASLQAKKAGYVIDDGAKESLVAYFDSVQQSHAKDAGNGRFARNVVEEAILKQSMRVMNADSSSLEVLLLEDFSL